MNPIKPPNFPAVLHSAGRLAMQWRLLLLWVAALLIPAALATFPFWQVMAKLLDHSVHAAELAQRLDSNSVGDLLSTLRVNGFAVSGGGIAGIVVTLLLSPFLSGAVIAAAKAPAPPSFGQLVHGGISDYGRLARVLIWAVVPLGIACGIGAGVTNLAGKFAEKTILESSADLANHAALILFLVLFFIADATVDAARAQFALSTRRRSAIKAWWRGLKMMTRRPLNSIGLYLVITAIGFLVAGGLEVLRINLPHMSHFGATGFVVALLLAQLAIAVTGWLRCARLFALIQLAKASQPIN